MVLFATLRRSLVELFKGISLYNNDENHLRGFSSSSKESVAIF